MPIYPYYCTIPYPCQSYGKIPSYAKLAQHLPSTPTAHHQSNTAKLDDTTPLCVVCTCCPQLPAFNAFSITHASLSCQHSCQHSQGATTNAKSTLSISAQLQHQQRNVNSKRHTTSNAQQRPSPTTSPIPPPMYRRQESQAMATAIVLVCAALSTLLAGVEAAPAKPAHAASATRMHAPSQGMHAEFELAGAPRARRSHMTTDCQPICTAALCAATGTAVEHRFDLSTCSDAVRTTHGCQSTGECKCSCHASCAASKDCCLDFVKQRFDATCKISSAPSTTTAPTSTAATITTEPPCSDTARYQADVVLLVDTTVGRITAPACDGPATARRALADITDALAPHVVTKGVRLALVEYSDTGASLLFNFADFNLVPRAAISTVTAWAGREDTFPATSPPARGNKGVDVALTALTAEKGFRMHAVPLVVIVITGENNGPYTLGSLPTLQRSLAHALFDNTRTTRLVYGIGDNDGGTTAGHTLDVFAGATGTVNALECIPATPTAGGRTRGRRQAGPTKATHRLTGRGIAGPEKWLNIYFAGPATCLRAVLQDSECAKDYFTYAARGDGNCGCKTAGLLEVLSYVGDGGQEETDYYVIDVSTDVSTGVDTSSPATDAPTTSAVAPATDARTEASPSTPCEHGGMDYFEPPVVGRVQDRLAYLQASSNDACATECHARGDCHAYSYRQSNGACILGPSVVGVALDTASAAARLFMTYHRVVSCNIPPTTNTKTTTITATTTTTTTTTTISSTTISSTTTFTGTIAPVTVAPATEAPDTEAPDTEAPATAKHATHAPTTARPSTTAAPAKGVPTTAAPTSGVPAGTPTSSEPACMCTAYQHNWFAIGRTIKKLFPHTAPDSAAWTGAQCSFEVCI